MKKPVPLVALQDQDVGGRAVRAGEVFDVDPAQAAILTYQKRAKFAPKSIQARDLTAESSSTEPKPRSRRQYRRRDLVSER